MVRILINPCDDPSNCMKCIEACSFNILALNPAEVTGVETVAKWTIIAVFSDLCNACKRCVEACPEGRIKIFAE
jgi:ferredoxin